MIEGFSLKSDSIAVFVNTVAACQFSADGVAAADMVKAESTYKGQTYFISLKAGRYPNAKVSCTNSAGTDVKQFGSLTVGG
ncbi:hypothetical protein ACFP81_06620 [Deinococcus lacus]|uniref:Uncharacterized protein n=1 Tax=Deinococcus lacus TaxID=392561 RepID=A0ABW1YDY8_9DEIO